jgi:hypothetical protein
MKTKRIIILAVIAVLLVVYVVSILPNFRHRAEWKRTVAALQSVSVERLSTAARRFARDQKVGGTTVPLRSLLSAGYLRPEEVRGLEGRDVSIWLTANETTPEAAVIRVRASDGSDVVLLADGSIQKLVRR